MLASGTGGNWTFVVCQVWWVTTLAASRGRAAAGVSDCWAVTDRKEVHG